MPLDSYTVPYEALERATEAVRSDWICCAEIIMLTLYTKRYWPMRVAKVLRLGYWRGPVGDWWRRNMCWICGIESGTYMQTDDGHVWTWFDDE